MSNIRSTAAAVAVTLLVSALCLLTGCGKSRPSAADWFPFEKGKTWRVRKAVQYTLPNKKDCDSVRSVLPTDACTVLTVQDASVGEKSCTATLRIPAKTSYGKRWIPPSMKITAKGQELRINFLINPYNTRIDVPMQLEPELCILRVPVVDGDSWEWKGKAVAVDEGESVGRQRLEIPARAVVTIRKTTELKKEARKALEAFRRRTRSGHGEELRIVPENELDYEYPDNGVGVHVEMVFGVEGRSYKQCYDYAIAPGIGIQCYMVTLDYDAGSGPVGRQRWQWFTPE